MTLKKLQFEDLADDYLGQDNPEQNITEFGEFRRKPFWCNNNGNTIDCCFNHLVGLPVKKGVEHPIYDYEEEIYDTIENNQHLWCKKARGIGFTTFMIRYLAWKCLVDDSLAGHSIFIIAGTEAGFAKELKDKIADLFDKKFPRLKLREKYNQLILNKTRFKSFPTKNLKDMRGYTDVSFIFIDEADYFDLREQEEIGAVIRSYEEKSDCKIIMVSTPHRPDGLFYAIETNHEFKGFFKKIEMLYERGLDRIFDRQQINRIKQDNPEFEREYNGKYIGKVGNVFPDDLVKKCIELGDSNLRLRVNQKTFHPVGVDFGYNISKCVVCVGEWEPEKKLLRIVHIEDFGDTPPTPSQVANELFDIYVKYGQNTHFFLDGSNRGSVNEAKVKFGENVTGWEKADFSKRDRIHPINFGTEHKQLLRDMYIMCTKDMIGIPSVYEKLITSMRTAQAEDFDLNKNDTVHNDYLDAARLMCRGFRFQ